MQNALNCQSEDPVFNHVKSLKISMLNLALRNLLTLSSLNKKVALKREQVEIF
jgi:hypothetical protein